MADWMAVSTVEQWERFRARHSYTHRWIDGVSWEYIAAGVGDEALLLLPGGPGRGETSFQYILAFAERYRVIAPSYPAEIRSAEALVDGLVGLLQAERIEHTHVLGGSYSGMIAQALLRRHQELVDRIVLADTGAPNRCRARHIRWLLHGIDVLPFGVVRAVLKLGTYGFVWPMGTDRRFWRRYFWALLDGFSREDLRARLAVAMDMDAYEHWTPWRPDRWDGAILVLDAHGDRLFGVEQVELRRLYPEAAARTIGDRGHAGSLADARSYIAAIAAFLQGKALGGT